MTEFESARLLMVIPSINGGALLSRMLPTLRVPGRCVIVLDQGSTDDTPAICTQNGVELVQLDRPHTYTEACNIGARIARERGVDYLCISNNDIAFKTDVLRQMIDEMDQDPRLGIIAPSQVIIDEMLDIQPLSYRVCWNLETVEFFHDTVGSSDPVHRLEADFCELTCALIRLSAIDEVGFLDDEYGFYHEDADFGFRLQAAGYSCAYLPKAQIDHFSSSTFNREKNERKANYIAKNKIYFAERHLGLRLKHTLLTGSGGGEYSFDRTLNAYFASYGLLHESGPELVIGQPGPDGADYLLTTFSGAAVPKHWLRHVGRYKALMVGSRWMAELLVEATTNRVYYIPIGVETDVFHPWGPALPRGPETTYLMIVNGAQPARLKTALEAWRRFNTRERAARLVLLGSRLEDVMRRSPDASYRSGAFRILQFLEEGIEIHEIQGTIDSRTLAKFYRAADYSLFILGDVASTIPILESIACGTPCLFGGYGPTAEFVYEGAMTFGRADDGSLLSGLQPDVDDLVRRLEESHALGDEAYARLSRQGLNFVRSNFTVRHTVMALYKVLLGLQTRDPSEKADSLRRRPSSGTQAIGWQTERGVVRSGLRHRFGIAMARRVTTLGRLIQQFGKIWQEKGLKAATQIITAELRLFTTHRSRQLWRLSSRCLRSTQDKLRHRLAPRMGKSVPIANAALLIGYIDADLGLGESLRGLALALSETDVRFAIYPFTVGVEGRRSAPYLPERYDRANIYAVNVIEVATNELNTVFDNVPKSHFAGSYNVLRTYWELSRAPSEWRTILRQIDEIWAPNTFVAESFRAVFDGTISIVPPCVQVPAELLDGRKHFNLDHERYYILFSFDYYSFPERKNPLAVVRAFQQAFPDVTVPVALIVKSIGEVDHFPEIKQQLRDASRQDSRIEIIDKNLDRTEMLSLIKASDCYVSLHRAEGFGLGMAEAMAFGKTVIATDYSGSTEFVTPETGYPIPYKLRKVPAGAYIHEDGQVWAEPSESACAAAMVSAFKDRAEAAKRAEAGRDFVMRRFGAANVGKIAADRLKAIFEMAARGDAR